MHIVLLNDDALPDARGGSAVVAELQRIAYVQQGHTVTLITTHQDVLKEKEVRWSDEGGDVISLYVDYPLSERHRNCIKMAAVSEKIALLLQELQPDLVHAHVIHTYLTYDCLRIARHFTDKVFMTAHDTYLVSFDRIKGRRYYQSVLENKPFKMHWWEHLLSVGRKYSPSRNRKIREILKETDTKIIAVSHAIKKILTENGISNVITIHNAAKEITQPSAEEITSYRSSLGLIGPTVLYGGRINEDKGIKVLLQAMELVQEKIPDAQLLVVGEKERLAPHAGDQKGVVCTGWIDQSQMPLAYSAADVVTTPSIYLDAFNLMNIEAMMMERPVVGTCFGGTAEIIEDEKTGFIRNPLDIKRFAEAIIHLLEQKEIAQTMGQEGKRRAQEKFSLEGHIRKHLELYSS